MSYAADLHIHSRFARGTSKHLTLPNLAHWAKLKGIDLMATGDFTQPVWREEIRGALRDRGDDLFELDGTLFVLGTEVNCNAEQGGRNRRVHLLVLAPSFETVDSITAAVSSIGKLQWDGRPTLHVTPRELLETLLEIDDRCIMMPAHLWTPWFGLYGSKSGFDSLEECFGDLLPHIHAVETGLSSDPAMNWSVPSLDGVSLVSFSDAHSPANLGRELTVFKGEPSYDGLATALREQSIEYTAEFFPEEGKYHHSGHRKCGVRFGPAELSTVGERCPECGRPLTMGVLQRVHDLSSRDLTVVRVADGLVTGPPGRPPFRNLVALQKVLAESLGIGPATKGVGRAYEGLVAAFGSELAVLVNAPPSEIAHVADARTAEAVARVRAGEVYIEPGYDGEYGTVRVWPPEA